MKQEETPKKLLLRRRHATWGSNAGAHTVQGNALEFVLAQAAQ